MKKKKSLIPLLLCTLPWPLSCVNQTNSGTGSKQASTATCEVGVVNYDANTNEFFFETDCPNLDTLCEDVSINGGRISVVADARKGVASWQASSLVETCRDRVYASSLSPPSDPSSAFTTPDSDTPVGGVREPELAACIGYINADTLVAGSADCGTVVQAAWVDAKVAIDKEEKSFDGYKTGVIGSATAGALFTVGAISQHLKDYPPASNIRRFKDLQNKNKNPLNSLSSEEKEELESLRDSCERFANRALSIGGRSLDLFPTLVASGISFVVIASNWALWSRRSEFWNGIETIQSGFSRTLDSPPNNICVKQGIPASCLFSCAFDRHYNFGTINPLSPYLWFGTYSSKECPHAN